MTLIHGGIDGITRVVPELVRCFEFQFAIECYATAVQQMMVRRILWIQHGLVGLTTAVVLLHNDRILSHLAFAFLLLKDLLMRAAVGPGRMMVDWHSLLLLVVLGAR